MQTDIAPDLAAAAAALPFRVYLLSISNVAMPWSAHATQELADASCERFNESMGKVAAVARHVDKPVPTQAEFDRQNAAASADAFLAGYGMPTYSELVEAMRKLSFDWRFSECRNDWVVPTKVMGEARTLLARLGD